MGDSINQTDTKGTCIDFLAGYTISQASSLIRILIYESKKLIKYKNVCDLSEDQDVETLEVTDPISLWVKALDACLQRQNNTNKYRNFIKSQEIY